MEATEEFNNQGALSPGMAKGSQEDKGIAEKVIGAPAYKEQYKDYKFIIYWPHSEPLDPENEAVDVILKTANGQEYWGNFITMKYLAWLFEKNKRTGECAGGIYFSMGGNMVVVERITEENIRKTIDDMIENKDVEEYFKKEEIKPDTIP